MDGLYPPRPPRSAWPPDGFAGWLDCTIDANCNDQYVIEKAAELGNDPQAIFEYVRSLGYENYVGSMRGARGTLWSQAGSSLDQASLLIALLRGQGTPARYRHGRLTTEQARELIRSMFPTTGAVVGYAAPEAELSDPLNDPELLAEAQDHWWVEAYQQGQWQALDPSFQQTRPGQTMTAPVGQPLAEPPLDRQHTVTVSVEAEFYQQLNYLQNGLTYQYPLSHTFTTVELVGQPLTLEHLVATEDSGACLIFCWTRYTYVPYLRLGDNNTIIKQGQFFELLSNFPLGQFAITAEWLHFDVRDAAGQVSRYSRQIADRLKAGPRTGELRQPKKIKGLLTADVISSLGPGLPSLVNELDSHTIYLTPSWMPARYAATVGEAQLVAMPEIATVHSMRFGIGDIEAIMGGQRPRNLGMVELKQAAQSVVGVLQGNNRMLGASYVTLSDQASQDLAKTGLVRAYPDAPRITIVSSIIQQTSPPEGGTKGGQEPTMSQILDLLHDNVRVVAYPGQAKFAEKVYRMTRGMNDTFLESAVGESLSLLATAPPEPVEGEPVEGGGEIRSAAKILQAAEQQGIPLIYLDKEHLRNFQQLNISTQAQTFIREAVKQGYGVFVPQRMVAWHGGETIAWWELNLETGEMIGVGENGTHQFLALEAAGAVVFMHAVRGFLSIVALVMRARIWRETAENTWSYFWDESTRQAVDDYAAGRYLTGEQPDLSPAERTAKLKQFLKERMLETKSYMNNNWATMSHYFFDNSLT